MTHAMARSRCQEGGGKKYHGRNELETDIATTLPHPWSRVNGFLSPGKKERVTIAT